MIKEILKDVPIIFAIFGFLVMIYLGVFNPGISDIGVNIFWIIFFVSMLLLAEIIYLLDAFDFSSRDGAYENSFWDSLQLKFFSLMIGAIGAFTPAGIGLVIVENINNFDKIFNDLINWLTGATPIIIYLAIALIIFVGYVVFNMVVKQLFFSTEVIK